MSDGKIEKYVNKIMQLIPNIMQMLNVYAPKFNQFEKFEDFQLSMPQWKAVTLFIHKDSFKMTELAKIFGLTLPTMTHCIDQLVKKDIVKRNHDEKDRRIVLISLTVKGQEIIKKIESCHRDMMTSLLKNLTTDDQKAFIVTLENLLGILKRQKEVK
ncbi:MAG: MarR family transcriptional regulator [Candidatus Firestonebacteria bacterium]